VHQGPDTPRALRPSRWCARPARRAEAGARVAPRDRQLGHAGSPVRSRV